MIQIISQLHMTPIIPRNALPVLRLALRSALRPLKSAWESGLWRSCEGWVRKTVKNLEALPSGELT